MEQIEDVEAIMDLTAPDAVMKMRTAGDIANKVLEGVIAKCVDGAKIVEICAWGDAAILEAVAPLYKTRKDIYKGIAFPVCISVNECAGHFSPLKDDTTTLKTGDVAKIDLGVAVDGWPAVVAHTTVVGGAEATGVLADCLAAAHQAGQAVQRMVRSGGNTNEMTAVIEKIATAYGVKPVTNIVSHNVSRFTLDGEKVIFGFHDPLTPVPKASTVAENEVYVIDMIMSSGDGKVTQQEARTTVYRRVIENQYNLKHPAGRDANAYIMKNHDAFPFSARSFENEARGLLGIKEMREHDLIESFPVSYEKPGVVLAQFKFTMLVLGSSTPAVTGIAPPPFKSEKSCDDEQVKTILTRSLKIRKKKAKTAAAPAAEAAKPAN